MGHWRRVRDTGRKDENQQAIVDSLKKIPGVSVEVGHDDILVGYKQKTFWYEIKKSKPTPSQIKPDQYRIWETFTGHYKIVWSVDMILDDIGVCIK